MTENNAHHDCASCESRHSTEWRDLSGESLAKINMAKRTRQMQPGEILFHQGDMGKGVYCIQSGLVGLRHIDELGNSVLLRLNGSGTTVGYRSFLSREPHSSSAEILSPSTICYIANSKIKELLVDNQKVGERFLEHALEDMKEAESSYARSLSQGMRSRFLHLILVFYERIGYRDDNGKRAMDLPVKRTDIAELIGVQPESLSRLVKKLRKEGLVDFRDRHVTFSNMDAILDELGAMT